MDARTKAIYLVTIWIMPLAQALGQELAHGVDQQADLDDIYSMDLEELLQVEIQTDKPG
jgi:hypothetical protein